MVLRAEAVRNGGARPAGMCGNRYFRLWFFLYVWKRCVRSQYIQSTIVICTFKNGGGAKLALEREGCGAGGLGGGRLRQEVGQDGRHGGRGNGDALGAHGGGCWGGSSEPEPDDEDDTETDLARPRAARGMVMGAVGRVFLSLEAMVSGGRKEGARPATREALYAVESPLL